MWRVFQNAFVGKLGYIAAALLIGLLLHSKAHAALVYGWSGCGGSGTSSTATAAGTARAVVCTGTIASGASYVFTGVTRDDAVAGGLWAGTDRFTFAGGDSSTAENDTTGGGITDDGTSPPAPVTGGCHAGQVADIEMGSGTAGAVDASVCASNGCGFTLGPQSTFRTYAAGGMKTSQSATGTGGTCTFGSTPAASKVVAGGALDSPSTNVADCQSAGGNVGCVVQTGQGAYCGTYNGDYICVGQVAPGACQAYTSGGAACTTNAATGAAGRPDNGTAGTPATPTATLTDAAGNVTGYYTPAAVAASSQGVVTTGTGTTGAKTGGACVPSAAGVTPVVTCAAAGTGSAAVGSCPPGQSCSGVTDSNSGGLDCVTPPVCTDTDPNICGIMNQSWLDRCATFTSDQLASAVGDPNDGGVVSSTSTDVSAVMNEALIVGDSGTCPGPVVITIMGKTVSYDIWSGLCRFAGSIALILMVVAYMVAARVFFVGVTANSI